MSVLQPLVVDREAALSRRNPVAKLGAAFLVTVGLLVTLDPVTPAVLLGLQALAFPLTGVRLRVLARRSWPLLLGVGGVALANIVVTRDPGSAFTVSLRLLAVTLPGIVVLATTDPMDLADALVQRWRVPARFAYGALAALRLLPLLSADWHTVARARRARGLDPGRSPIAHLRAFAAQVFAVLVAAVRRGVRLAAAMDARGFGATGVQRTVARPQPMRGGDWALVVATGAAVLLATAVSVAVGAWRLPFA